MVTSWSSGRAHHARAVTGRCGREKTTQARTFRAGLLLATLTLLSPAPRAGTLVNPAPQAMLTFLQAPGLLEGMSFALSHGDACRALAGQMPLVLASISSSGRDVHVYYDAAGGRYVTVRGSNPVRVTLTAGLPEFRGGALLAN